MPNPGKPNKKDFDNDANSYFRRIMLRSHFGNEETPAYEGFSAKGNPEWTPNKIHHTVKTYIQAVKKILTKTRITKPTATTRT